MPEDPNPARTGYAFGLKPVRVRGFLLIFIVAVFVYVFLFESNPPPDFSEVDIAIPERPEPQFDERTIVLPDFEPSPVASEEEPGEGVVITAPEKQLAPSPVEVEIEIEEESQPEQETAADIQPAEEAVPTEKAQPAAPPAEQETAPGDSELGTAHPLEAGTYFVQVAALKSKESADQLSADLQVALKVPAYLETVERDSSRLHRVRLGPFTDQAQARNALERLRKLNSDIGEHAFVDAN